VLWGDAATVRERLKQNFSEIRTEIIPVEFDMPMSPAGTVEFFRKYFGPTQVAFSRLDEGGQAAFAKDLVGMWSSANTAPDPAEHTVIRNEYLQVIATRN
jgi:hypothetical protein